MSRAAVPRKAFTESISEVLPRARVTGRLRQHTARAIGSRQSVAAVTARPLISWPVAHNAFVAHADEVLVEPAPPVVLGIDETRRGRPRWARDPAGWWRRLARLETNFVDLAGAGGLLGQTAGRTGTAVGGWLDACGQAWKDAVQVVARDPCAGYGPPSNVRCRMPGSSSTTSTWCGWPTRWSPRCGSGSPANSSVAAGSVTTRPGAPAAAARRRPAVQPASARLSDLLRRDDPTDKLGAGWAVKELLRQLLTARQHTIAARLHRFYQAVAAIDLPEATRLAATVDACWPKILGFLETRITNAGTEGTNRMAKDAARIAFGFRNLDHQRRRVRFHCTRQSRRPTSAEAVKPPQL